MRPLVFFIFANILNFKKIKRFIYTRLIHEYECLDVFGRIPVKGRLKLRFPVVSPFRRAVFRVVKGQNSPLRLTPAGKRIDPCPCLPGLWQRWYFSSLLSA